MINFTKNLNLIPSRRLHALKSLQNVHPSGKNIITRSILKYHSELWKETEFSLNKYPIEVELKISGLRDNIQY